MNQVLVLGGVSFDTTIYLDILLQPVPQTIFSHGFHETVGSTGAGKALNLGKLGVPVTLHALIGDDDYGQRIQAYLRTEPVTFVYDLDLQGTPRHVNMLDPNGQRISIFLVAGTFAPTIDRLRLEAAITAHDYVVVNIINYCRTLIPIIQQQNKPIWCDIHDYDGVNPYHNDFIQAADYLFLSSDALPDYRAFMERMRTQGKHLVVCTHGKHGATALAASGEWIEQPRIITGQSIDSNGAGDAFFAGVLYGYIQSYPLYQCLRLGALLGSLNTTTLELALPALDQNSLKATYYQAYREELA